LHPNREGRNYQPSVRERLLGFVLVAYRRRTYEMDIEVVRGVGRTSIDGGTVEERLDPTRQNLSSGGRLIRLVEPGFQPLREILA
jgi:hypothetical protein